MAPQRVRRVGREPGVAPCDLGQRHIARKAKFKRP
jgi:hypothetical protein